LPQPRPSCAKRLEILGSRFQHSTRVAVAGDDFEMILAQGGFARADFRPRRR
jgi:hypothetical protein